MLSAPEKICLIVAVAETIMGTSINAFIGLVSCIVWVKSRKLSLVESILMSLALVRILLHWVMLVNGLLKAFYKDLLVNNETMLIFLYFWVMMNNCSVSLATCLNIFYFLKIAHFSHPFFLWLKWRINKVVLMILLGSLTMFVLLNLTLMGEFREDFIESLKRKEMKNHTRPFQMENLRFNAEEILFYSGQLVLLVMSLICCCLLILSLWRHARQMQFSATGFRDLSTEAHVRVMRWMISYIFLTILYYLSIFLSISITSMLEQRLAELLRIVLAGFYPSGHSFILILGNSKMKRTSLWMWHQTLLRLQGGKP